MIVEADDISDEQKARICKKLAEADKVILISKFAESLKLLNLVSIGSK